MGKQCGGITRDGKRCARSVEGPNGLCWLHDPTRADERRRAASKAGKSKPSKEIVNIRGRLSELAEDVLAGRVDRGDAAVAGQLLGTVIRAIGMELKIKEQNDLLERIEQLEAMTSEDGDGGGGWRDAR